MMKKRPAIGITPWYDYETGMTFIKPGYMEAVLEAGGLPLLLPVVAGEVDPEALLRRFDGLLLSGGPDLDATLYREENLPCNGTISPLRDGMEMALARKAAQLDMPVLGICRGMQVLNAAMGGTLYQDIHSQMGTQKPDPQWQPGAHSQPLGQCLLQHTQNAPKWYPIHQIQINPGSVIYRAFGKSAAGVNSFHHQAVKDVAPEMAVTSGTSDGVIESIEHLRLRFMVGVQWHPELMWQRDRTYLRIFEEFVTASGEAAG